MKTKTKRILLVALTSLFASVLFALVVLAVIGAANAMMPPVATVGSSKGSVPKPTTIKKPGFSLSKKEARVWRARIRYVNQLIEEEGRRTWIPTALLKAMFWLESLWQQYNSDGTVYATPEVDNNGVVVDYSYGVGQLTGKTVALMHWDLDKVKHDARYNIRCSIRWLEIKHGWVTEKLKSDETWDTWHRLYGLLGYSKLEIAVRAYNGLTENLNYLDLVIKIKKTRPWENYLEP